MAAVVASSSHLDFLFTSKSRFVNNFQGPLTERLVCACLLLKYSKGIDSFSPDNNRGKDNYYLHFIGGTPETQRCLITFSIAHK